MTTLLLEHRVALKHNPEDPFTNRDIEKACKLLKRLRDLQWRGQRGDATRSSEGERAALLWALKELGVICGKRTEERRNAADLRCIRPPEHGGPCDDVLGRDR